MNCIYIFQYKNALVRFDNEILGLILDMLEKDIPDANLVIVGDHGFSDTHPNRTEYLDDYLDPKSFKFNTAGSLTDLRPSAGFTVDQLIHNLTALNSSGNFKIYR